jgi:hypothetical protein
MRQGCNKERGAEKLFDDNMRMMIKGALAIVQRWSWGLMGT